MSIAETFRYISEVKKTGFLGNRSIQSSLMLKRLVKPRLLSIDICPPLWFYTGVKRDYVVIPRVYCSCKSFVINVMSRKSVKTCRHLLIQAIGEENGLYREAAINDLDTLYKIVKEILDLGISPTLRRVLHSGKR